MKFGTKQQFIALVLCLIFVILFSSYLGIYMKEGFEEDDEEEEEGEEENDYGYDQNSDPEYIKYMKALSERKYQDYDAEFGRDADRFKEEQDRYEDEEDEEEAEDLARENETKEFRSNMNQRLKGAREARSAIKSDLAKLSKKSDKNTRNMGELDFIPSSERGDFAKQSMVTGFFTGANARISNVGKAAYKATSSAEEAKAKALEALNKANEAPPAPDLSGYATKQMMGKMRQRLGGYATKASLSGYATQADLDTKMKSTTEGNYATQDQLNNLRNEFNRKFLKHGDEITLRSRKTGRRLQDAGYGRFGNHNRMWWERFHIEKCGLPGMYDNRQCR